MPIWINTQLNSHVLQEAQPCPEVQLEVGPGGPEPPGIWQISKPYSKPGGRLCPSHYCQPPRIQKAIYTSDACPAQNVIKKTRVQQNLDFEQQPRGRRLRNCTNFTRFLSIACKCASPDIGYHSRNRTSKNFEFDEDFYSFFLQELNGIVGNCYICLLNRSIKSRYCEKPTKSKYFFQILRASIQYLLFIC